MGSYTTDNACKRAHDEDMKDPEYAAQFEASKRQMISRYERGQEPAISILRKILAALQADIVIKAHGASSIMLNAS